jgi:hypothetical protein
MSNLNTVCRLSLLLCAWPGEALQLVGTVIDMECCYLTAEVFRTILLAGSPAAAATGQVQAQLHNLPTRANSSDERCLLLSAMPCSLDALPLGSACEHTKFQTLQHIHSASNEQQHSARRCRLLLC